MTRTALAILLSLGPVCEATPGPADPATHWSLRSVASPSVSGREDQPGALNPIDAFVGARLAGQGLAMSPPADRRTLIRRLSFDLHGLPPAPEAVEAFVKDTDPEAYENLVDRMLASPHYGERYARHWLDIAHYADTHGFERDRRRDNAWRYRDYVIDSFNDDKRYDRFLEEQIAGDVLWPERPDAVVATGFLAAGPWDFTGQQETPSPVLKRAARALDLDDMVTQVMTATVASTVNCARCHDHKLDPVTQEEYYQLWAVFSGVQRTERLISKDAGREFATERKGLTAERNELRVAIGKIEGRGVDLADLVGGGNGSGTGTYRDGIDPRTARVETRNLGRLGQVQTNKFAPSPFPFIDGVVIPDGGGGMATIPVSTTGLSITGLPSTSQEAWDVIRNGPVASQHSNDLGGIDFTKDGHSLLGLHANAGITFDLAAIRAESGTKAMRFTSQLGYFGAPGTFQADAWVYLDGRKVFTRRGLNRGDGLQPIDIPLPVPTRFLTLLSTDGGNGISHDQVGFGDPRLVPDPPRTATPAELEQLAGLKAELGRVEARIGTLGPSPKVYAVVTDKSIPEIRVLERGDPESPRGDPLAPGTLASVSALDPVLGTHTTDPGERRAALAKWITDARNPLTCRVIVNRLWHWHFGQGIVKTPSDFGAGGDKPSHPDLLDWLAGEFQRQGWSLKAMHRLILTSATYRQQSHHGSDARGIAVDADNRLLWRQNPRRIEAEAVRDAVLATSGKLNLQRGGPGFEDFVYTEAYAPIYEYIPADEPGLWRRSIYRFVVRTTPDRFLAALDCPDPANFTPVRSTTTTALQSLALYNNEFILRQARYFAERVGKEAGDNRAHQVQRAFALALGRPASGEELDLATEFITREGLFAFCRSLLNANEFVYVD